jgi:hypothetical protein
MLRARRNGRACEVARMTKFQKVREILAGGKKLKVTIGPLRGRTLHITVRGAGDSEDGLGRSDLDAFRCAFADELESVRKRRT